MKFNGTVDINAPRDRVWAFLMDPDQVGPCGPGVESIEVVDADHFTARAKVGIGFISARFNISMPGVERAVARALVDEAHEICPYSKATRGNIEVAINLV